MKRWMHWAAALTVFLTLGLVMGCSDDDDNGGTQPTVKTDFELLTEYMAANNLDLPDLLSSWIVTAQAVFDEGLENYFIIDIRSAEDFEDGHIEGAHNTTLADVVTYEAANNMQDLPVIVVCYTGQSAGHAVMALRLKGVSDARVLQWGMSGWNSAFDRWTANTGNAALDYSGAWTSGDDPPALPSYDAPEIDTQLTDGAAILDYQVDHAILDGFNRIGATDVLGDYDAYQVITFWAESDWDAYGHVTGAYQVAPGTLSIETLDALDPDATVVVYCWTGQTSSMVTAWLNALGYDAVSLTFGVNSMIYDDLTGHKWDPAATPAELPYESPDTEFTILADYMAANSLDLPDLLSGWIVNAQDIFDLGTENYFILDIRQAADYEDGHITGAHNVALADVVTYEAANNTAGDPVVVVCYTGQSAGHAVMALRLSGIDDAAVLKWGMSGWNSDLDRWTANIGNAALDYAGSWTSGDDPPALDSFSDPDPATGLTDGAAILQQRISEAILDGFNGVGAADVLADYDSYQTFNFWTEADWDTYGHVTGAYQIAPGDLSIEALSALDPSATNVIYCWTGQTSSMVTAWLSVFGFEAKSLTFGVNSMIYDDLTAHNWSAAESAELPYETGPLP